ncbi:MAG: DUF4263 domain-containing protein [Sporomusaceae bacterium]|nr:DUF4263 domain-containing protein [Sporomusaceae bacterium]
MNTDNHSNILTIKSTSKNTATVNDIVLRELERARLVFRPQMVNNQENPSASIKGVFIYQRKDKNSSWEDLKEFDLNQLKSGEGFKLELKSRELLELFQQVEQLYKIYGTHGIPYGQKKFILTDKNSAQIIEAIMDNDSFITELLQKNNHRVVFECVKKLAEIGNLPAIIEKLKDLEIANLEQLNSVIGITTLKRVEDIWEQNKSNSNEDFWQKTFKNHSWVISQVFACPVVIMKEKVYVGGKGIDNEGGKAVDFVYQNKVTENIVLIEIKTPQTKLIGSEYRDDVYSISQSLSGTINQVLFYKDEFQKNYYSLCYKAGSSLSVLNPKCVVIAGSLENEMSDKAKRSSFEIFRRELKDVEVITFDELFGKVKLLLNLLCK